MEKVSHLHIDQGIHADKNPEGFKKRVEILDKIGGYRLPGELDKNTYDKEIIDFTQKSLNDYFVQNGRERLFDVTDEKIHIFTVGGVEDFLGGEGEEGAANFQLGSLIVDRNPNNVIFSIRLFHELYHIKVHSALRNDKQGHTEEHRSGFTVMSTDGKTKYFYLINELVNDYFCKKFFAEKIKNSNLFSKKEIEAYEFDSPRNEQAILFEKELDDLYERNKNDFSNKEEIRKLFINADLNGRLLPVARLIEKTYGPGSFRSLGEKTSRTEDQ